MSAHPVQCPLCTYRVPVPVEQMVDQAYRMDSDGEITLASLPPAVAEHLATHTEAEQHPDQE